MQPVQFDGCFGWLHAAGGTPSGHTAVLLCRGLGADGLTAHRSLLLLADSLAQAGYPTLRFDYPGSGDSRDAGPADHWSVWQRSIHDAADWLRDHTGAERVVLCGLGIGATLAAAVAEHRVDVAALVLLAPVLLGRAFVRQLNIESISGRATIDGEGGLAVHGLRFSDASLREIAQVDLRHITFAPSVKLVVYARTMSRMLSECVDAWSRSGSVVEAPGFSGLEPMLRATFMAHEAPADVTQIVTWVSSAAPAGPAQCPGLAVPPGVALHVGDSIEEPLRFGPGNGLFGMLCRPARRDEADTVVVIANSGGDPHYGYARGNVTIARQLAQAGFASLRMDFAGLGDSRAPDDGVTHVFETDRRADIAAALDVLASLGYRRFALQGVCSGAYHAFHGALADPRVGVLVAVNMPVFQWRNGFPVEFLDLAKEGPRSLLPKFAELEFWRSLFRGQVDFRNHLAAQLSWLAARGRDCGGWFSAWFGRTSSLNFGQSSMLRLSTRTRTLFLLSPGDTAATTLAQTFGHGRAPPGATIATVTGLDHTMSSAAMQTAFTQKIIAFIEQDQPSRA